MTSFSVAHAELVPYTLDIGRPLRTARGDVRFRRGYLVRIDDGEGHSGWGDAACFPGLGSNDAAVGARLANAMDHFKGTRFVSLQSIEDWLDQTPYEPEARAALELALLDLLGRRTDRRIAELLGGGRSARAATHVLIGSLDVDLAATGASAFKLKIGRNLEDDVNRVRELRRRAGDTATLRLDAGGGYSYEDAARAIELLAPLRVDFIEDPVRPENLEDMARLSELGASHGIRIAADENVTDEASIDAIADARCAGVVILKPMFVGGLLVTRRLAQRAAARGIEAVVTHALESAIGRTGTMHLAATLPGTHGLAWSPAEDLALAPEPRGSFIELPRSAGLGITPRNEARRDSPRPSGTRPPRVVPHPVASSALARPDHVALVFGTTQLTYRELVARVARLAGALGQRGIRAGERVTIQGAADLDWVVLFHAIGWLGAVACLLPHRARAAESAAICAAFDASHTIDAKDAAAASDAHAEPLPEPSLPLDSPRVVVATSGSTGVPRAIELTTEQLAWNAFGSALRLGHHTDDAWLCPLPLHHVGGLSILWRTALGATTAILHERFDAQAVAAALDSGEVTLASLTPTMLERVLDVRPPCPLHPRVRAVLLGGGPTSDALLTRCRDLGVPVSLTWGMTEAASQVATREPGDCSPLEHGLPPLPFNRVHVARERLVVTGPSVGGELSSGDRGSVREGWVVVTGRIDDVIVHRGENIDPVDVERALLEHPGIADAAVVAIPSAPHGSDLGAVLVARNGALSNEAVLAHCHARLANFKVPTQFVWQSALPRTSLGKLARSSLRGVFEDGDAHERIEDAGRWPSGRHVGDVHEDVNKLGPSAHVLGATSSGEGVRKRHRPFTDTLDRERDIDAVVQADRPHEIRLGVDERHADSRSGQESVDALSAGEQELLVGGMAHLEDAPEEHDPRPIDLVKARSDSMNERYDHER